MPEQLTSGHWEERVREALAEKQTTVELTDALFGPKGIFAQVAGTREEREQILRHPLYKQAHSRLSDLRATEIAHFEADIAQIEGGPARLTIQIPKSLHASLKIEAARQGVSLSELVRRKLGLPDALLADMPASGSTDKR